MVHVQLNLTKYLTKVLEKRKKDDEKIGASQLVKYFDLFISRFMTFGSVYEVFFAIKLIIKVEV